MSRIERDGTAIEYKIRGHGDITLLFVHGSYFDQGYWRNQVRHFEPGYRVVTLDLPGHGESGINRAQWSMQGFAEDVCAVMDALGPGRIILIGHSMAGDVNLIAATRRPESVLGFIGVDAFKNAATPLPEGYRAQAEAILESLRSDFSGTNERYARMALLTPETPPQIADRVAYVFRNGCRPMGLGLIPEVFESHLLERELLPKLGCKLYLVNVDYRPTDEGPLKRYAGHGYEIIRLHGTSHFPMLENSKALNAALDGIVRKIMAESLVAA
jgi:pimeloyl-ACP methyl ester carboxylesterase